MCLKKLAGSACDGIKNMVVVIRQRITLDVYHKAICPTIQIALTITACIVAYQAFVVQEGNLVVQQGNAARSEKELNDRIVKLDKVQLTLQQHQQRIEDQQKTAMDLYNTAADLYKKNVSQAETDKKIYRLIMNYGNLMNDKYTNAIGIYAAHSIPANVSISNLAILASKSPIYSADEKAMMNTIIGISIAQSEALTLFVKFSKENDDAIRQIQEEYFKNMESASIEQAEALTKDCNDKLKKQSERFRLQLEKDMAEPNLKVKKLIEFQKEIGRKLDEKNQGKK